MSNPPAWLAICTVSVVAGAAGGVVGRYAAPAPQSRASSAAVFPDRAPADPVEIERRLDDLERRVARIGHVQVIPRVSETPSPAASDGRPKQGTAVQAVDDPVFEAAVRDVVEQLEEERRVERESRTDERRKQAAERWSTSLGDKLGLTEGQKQKVMALATDYVNELRAARGSDTEQVSGDEWRQKAVALREKSEARLSQVLDPTQRQKYDALEEDEKLGLAVGRRRR